MNNLIIILLVLLGWAVVSTIIAGVFWLMTRGVFGALLKTKLGKKNVLLIVATDKDVRFIPAEYEHGILKTKEFGDFVVTKDSLYIYKPLGIIVAFAYANSGVILPADKVATFTALKEKGIKDSRVANYVDAKLREEGKALGIELQKQIITWSDIRDFLDKNLNPAYIRSVIERQVANLFEQVRKPITKDVVLFILMLLVGGAIAYAIINNVMSNQQVTQELAQCKYQLGIARARCPQAFTNVRVNSTSQNKGGNKKSNVVVLG